MHHKVRMRPPDPEPSLSPGASSLYRWGRGPHQKQGRIGTFPNAVTAGRSGRRSPGFTPSIAAVRTVPGPPAPPRAVARPAPGRARSAGSVGSVGSRPAAAVTPPSVGRCRRGAVGAGCGSAMGTEAQRATHVRPSESDAHAVSGHGTDVEDMDPVIADGGPVSNRVRPMTLPSVCPRISPRVRRVHATFVPAPRHRPSDPLVGPAWISPASPPWADASGSRRDGGRPGCPPPRSE
jgi:hypothetical protein